MKAKPVVPRQLANQDVAEALAYYLAEDAEAAAIAAVAIERAQKAG